MSFDLTNKNISDTFQNLLQKTGSEGKLYDLEGNEITDLTIGGTLTAHSYITSESIVNTSSGSTAFGNSIDDTHIFTGSLNVTGSLYLTHIQSNKFGQITLSPMADGKGDVDITDGTIQLRSANTTNTGLMFHGGVDGVSNPYIQTNGFDTIDFKENLNLTGHITASGNISASGTIKSTGNISTDGSITADGANLTNLITDNSEATAVVTSVHGVLGKRELTNNAFDSSLSTNHITASGNISASGDLNIQNIYLDDSYSIYNQSENVRLRFLPSELKLVSGHLNVDSHITASGNISGSSISTLSIGGQATIGNDLNLSSDIYMDGEQAITRDPNGDLGIGSLDDGNQGKIYFHLGAPFAAEAMVISGSTGAVGIGTGTPVSKLQVVGDITSTHITASGNISASGTIFASAFSSPNGDGDIDFSDSLDISGNITASGNISSSRTGSFTGGIRADSNVDINGDLFINDGNFIYLADNKRSYVYEYNGAEVRVGADSHIKLMPDNDLYISPGGVDMAIFDSGNGTIGSLKVGIGTVTPTTRLQVAGDISASGFLQTDSYIQTDSHITASGNISSSGNIINTGNVTTTKITASGNISSSGVNGVHTLGGDLSVGRHLTIGSNATFTIPNSSVITNISTTHITASGNISASKNLSVTGNFDLDGKSNFQGHITASGNISGSSTSYISASSLAITGTGSFVGGVRTHGDIWVGDANRLVFDEESRNDQYISGQDDSLTIDADNFMNMYADNRIALMSNATTIGHLSAAYPAGFGLTVKGNMSQSGNFVTTGHITASGNISGSSTSTINVGGEVQSQGQRIGTFDGTNVRLGDSANPTVLYGTTLTTSVNITASGDISGSSTSTGSFGRLEGDGAGLSNVSATVSGDTFATDLKIGRDSHNLIDFTSDDLIVFRLNNVNEYGMNATQFGPIVDDGARLGAADARWSDLFLAEGAVINFDDGDVTITQTGNDLAIAGTTGTSFVGNITASGEISASDDIRTSGYFYGARLYLGTTDSRPRLVEDPTGHLFINTPTHIDGAVTASGNISGSSTSTFQIGGAATIGGGVTAGGTSTFGDGSGDTLRVSDGTNTGLIAHRDNTLVLQADTQNPSDAATPQVNIGLGGHITASGNISGSSTKTGSFGHLMVGGGNFSSASLAAGGGGGDISTGDNVRFGNITGSNISSSGDIRVGAGGDLYIDTLSKLYLDDDEDTAIYAPSEDTIRFLTNGANRAELNFIQLALHGLDLRTTGYVSSSKGAFFGTQYGTYVSMSADGEIEISGSGNAKFTVEGDISASGALYITSGSGQIIHAYSSSAAGAVVGIGTNAPTKRLTVEGDISASGDLHLGNPTHAIGGYTNNMGHPSGSSTTHIKSALGKGYGEIINMGNTTTVAGQIYCLHTDDSWVATDADGGCVSSSLLGVAMGTNSYTNGMLIRGMAQVSQSGQLTVGQKVYASTNPGLISGSAPPAAGDVVRVLGYGIEAGLANKSGSIYFNPDNTWILRG